MVFFIFILLLMFSLSGVLYLMVRALPRIAPESMDEAGGRHGLLDRWAHSEIPEKIDAWFNGFLLKFLRKFKVATLKLDNSISGHLRKIHKQKIEKKPIDFSDIVEAKEGDED
jgi:hypothetical protein